MKNRCRYVTLEPRARWLKSLLVMSALAVLGISMDSGACETDADCRVGGICIKREKRAHGVCYGGAPRDATSKDETPSLPEHEVPNKPVTGERREHAKEWLGDPEQMLKDNLPGKAIGGTCMVSQDCPAGQDCVIAGFEGHCVKL